jgi:hypothetical protein
MAGVPLRRAIAGVASALTLGLFVAAAPAAVAAPKAPIAPKNQNVSRMVGSQNEQTVAVNPTNPKNVVVTSNLDVGSPSLFSGLMEGYTFDGGHTWTSQVIATGHDGMGAACCDSTLQFDQYGNLFLSYLYTRHSTIPVFLSTDGGVTFTLEHTVIPTPAIGPAGPAGPSKGVRSQQPDASPDQQTLAVGAGSVWITYSSFTSNTLVIQAAGAPVRGFGQVGTWTGTQNVPTAQGAGDYGDIAIGPEGQVMVTYQDPTGGEGPADIRVSLDPDGLGPAGFSNPRLLAQTNVGGFDYIPAQLQRSVDAEANLAWDRDPASPHFGRVYAVWTSETPDESNDMDIMLQWSDNDGTTWSPAVRLNNDSSVNSQFMPAIALDQSSGAVAIAWFDCRLDLGQGGNGDTNGIPNDDAEFWGTYTLDGGATFAPNFRISRGTSNATDAGSFLDYGDYTHASFANGQFWPVWADNSNSTGDNPDGTLHATDIYTARVPIG